MYENLGIVEKIACAVQPVYFEMFGTRRKRSKQNRDITRDVGQYGDSSYAYRVDGKTFLTLDIEGLPVTKESDGTETPNGEVLIEGTVGGRVWFELCRIRFDGVYNLAQLTAAQAAQAAGGDAQAASSTLSGVSRINLFKIKGSITKLPKWEKGDPLVRVTVLGVSA